MQYAFWPPAAIERCCGINANRVENCPPTNSDLETRGAIARFQNNSRRFQQARYGSF
jgi:hypothetical protein